MGYCTLTELEKVLAQSLTTASPDTVLTGIPGKLTSIGKQFNLNLIHEDDADYYIRLADDLINAGLTQQYVTPLPELCDYETVLLASMDEYVDTISVSRATVFTPGEAIILTDGTNTERHEVYSIFNGVITTRDVISNIFYSNSTRVMRVKFPPPIPFISARLACAAIYDKYAKAQSEPSKTDYGSTLRKDAVADLNNIREGRTILHGVTRIGWRFANPNLVDRYGLKGIGENDGTRSDTQDRG